ncbi:hypothetical protein TRIUR3_12890 [Triticum urartu]|uniref:Secreted protein n=2 Tax=Triticum TaxID=4564 RepID=A0A9R0Y2B4_TRITD|nr:hypothetical protein TRIUR3_12890 [Triticum urartu]VAI47478.1 unnamed protein product [Triticum turgidum subsp. durum]
MPQLGTLVAITLLLHLHAAPTGLAQAATGAFIYAGCSPSKLFGRRIWEDRGYNNWHLGRASTPGGVHLFPQQSMLEAHTAQVTSSYSIRD